MIPFEAMQPYYQRLLSSAQVAPSEQARVNAVAAQLMAHRDRYEDIGHAAGGTPWWWVAPVHYRESNANFAKQLAQGDPLTAPSIHVPRGGPPLVTGVEFPVSFEYAAAWALRLDRIDQVGAGNWSLVRAAYQWELWNGPGYWARHRVSPYVFAGSSAYTSGKFVADGKFNPDETDKQLGCVPIAMALVAMAGISLPDAPPMLGPPPPPDPDAHRADVEWAQAALNKIGAEGAMGAPLVVDGSYGRMTRLYVRSYQKHKGLHVDGIVGPATRAALQNDLASR
jgi:lysozyme family protein